MSKSIAYLLGANKNVDVAYWQLANGSPPNPPSVAGYPVGITKDQYIKWSWRIQQWRMSGTVQATWNPGIPITGPPDTYLASLDWTLPNILLDLINPPSGAEERGLISNAFAPIIGKSLGGLDNLGWGFPSPQSYTISGGTLPPPVITPPTGHTIVVSDTTFLNVSFNLFQNGGPGNENYYDGSLFWPYCSWLLSFTLLFTLDGNPNNFTITVANHIAGFFLQTSTILFDNVSMGVWLGQSLGGGGAIVTPTCDITVDPNVFWAFKNRLGQPVYDTTTGDQINDPFA